MAKNVCLFLMIAVGVLLLGCDSTPEPPTKSQPEAQQVETGRFALQKMIAPARLWAADAQPIRLISSTGKENQGHDGKSAFWQATFGSASKQKAETFTWSGMAGPHAPARGVDHGAEDSFNPSNRSTQPFELAFLKIDSSQAFDVAQQHGGKKLTEKDPNQEVLYILDWDPRTSTVRWHVVYGDSPSQSQLTIIVNGSSGDFVHKE